MAIGYLAKAVTTVNTAVALSATSVPCCAFLIQADKDNLASVYFGDSQASSTSDQGIILSVTTGSVYPSGQFVTAPPGTNPIDLKDVYISSANSASRVNVIYFVV